MHHDHLDRLESESIFIMREAFAKFDNMAMLWSIGKDSTAMLWLARKAFFERYRHPAEDELAALHQRVHIVSLADPHDSPLSIFSAISRSAGKVTFMFFVLPSTSFGL